MIELIINGKNINNNICINDIVDSENYRNIRTKSACIYLSKKPVEVLNAKYWERIYTKNDLIEKIELHNADERFKADYSNMNQNNVDGQFEANNKILMDIYGEPNVKNPGGREYIFDWGKLVSYLDIKSGDVGIVAVFN